MNPFSRLVGHGMQEQTSDRFTDRGNTRTQRKREREKKKGSNKKKNFLAYEQRYERGYRTIPTCSSEFAFAPFVGITFSDIMLDSGKGCSPVHCATLLYKVLVCTWYTCITETPDRREKEREKGCFVKVPTILPPHPFETLSLNV